LRIYCIVRVIGSIRATRRSAVYDTRLAFGRRLACGGSTMDLVVPLRPLRLRSLCGKRKLPHETCTFRGPARLCREFEHGLLPVGPSLYVTVGMRPRRLRQLLVVRRLRSRRRLHVVRRSCVPRRPPWRHALRPARDAKPGPRTHDRRRGIPILHEPRSARFPGDQSCRNRSLKDPSRTTTSRRRLTGHRATHHDRSRRFVESVKLVTNRRDGKDPAEPRDRRTRTVGPRQEYRRP